MTTGCTTALGTGCLVACRCAPNPDDRALIKRVTRRGDDHFVGMPPLGTERVDDAAVALLRRWIQEMP
jgi:hypothetical protein